MTVNARLIATYTLPDIIPVVTSSKKPAFSASREEVQHLIRCDTIVACVRGKRIKYLELLVAPDFAWVPRIQAPDFTPARAATIESIVRHRNQPRLGKWGPDPLPLRSCYPRYPLPDERTLGPDLYMAFRIPPSRVYPVPNDSPCALPS